MADDTIEKVRATVLQMIGDGCDSHEISAKTGLSVGRIAAIRAHNTMGTYSVAPEGAEAEIPEAVETERDLQRALRTNIEQLEAGLTIVDDAVANAFKRIAEMPAASLVSEEDVKNKVVLPILRALGYDDADFNYERRTGRGYVDVVVEHFPTGIVVEAKAPRIRLEQYLEQLEAYVFHKHGRDRATVAILTNGESFNVYGVTAPLMKGELGRHRIMSFRRAEIKNQTLAADLRDLLGRESNQTNAILRAIETYEKKRTGRLGPIEAELVELNEQRKKIDERIHELELERGSILGVSRSHQVRSTHDSRDDLLNFSYPASPRILKLLKERNATSKSRAVERTWLDRQLINRVEGVNNHTAISWGLIELRKCRLIDHEGKPITAVWLTQPPGGSSGAE